MAADTLIRQIVYWHRELPPADAEVLGDGVIEALNALLVGAPKSQDERSA